MEFHRALLIEKDYENFFLILRSFLKWKRIVNYPFKTFFLRQVSLSERLPDLVLTLHEVEFRRGQKLFLAVFSCATVRLARMIWKVILGPLSSKPPTDKI